jgi:hypothetical protein
MDAYYKDDKMIGLNTAKLKDSLKIKLLKAVYLHHRTPTFTNH